jgi:hypothetical protein
MNYLSYRCRRPIEEQDSISEFVQVCGGWMTPQTGSVIYTVPEQYSQWLQFYDSDLEREDSWDWVA